MKTVAANTRNRKTARPATPATRTVRVLHQPTHDAPGLLSITAGDERAVYWFGLQGCQMGTHVQVRKFRTGETYDILLGDNPQDHSCTCLGHNYRGQCRHVDALHALIRAGQITPPVAHGCEIDTADDSEAASD